MRRDLIEIEGDENDLGIHGMDAATMKRLRVDRLMKKRKEKPRKPQRTKLPYSMEDRKEVDVMTRLRNRGYLGESIDSKEAELSSQYGVGSYSDVISKYYKSIVQKIVNSLPVGFQKKDTAAKISSSSYRAEASGMGKDFDWSVSVRGETSQSSTIYWISVEARVGSNNMYFRIGTDRSPDDFVGDIAEWMKSKQVVLVKGAK